MNPHDPAAQAGIESYALTPGAAGAMLRAAREAAGLSIDEVSHQLKLAPKQVQALEESDFAQLPGRTFVRGFARNYARLLQLDPQAVLDALPGASGAGLDSPALHATTITIGELPSDAKARTAWLGWLLLGAVAVIGAFLAWQYFQGKRTSAPPSQIPAAGTTPAPATSAPATGMSPQTAQTPALANPGTPAGTFAGSNAANNGSGAASTGSPAASMSGSGTTGAAGAAANGSAGAQIAPSAPPNVTAAPASSPAAASAPMAQATPGATAASAPLTVAVRNASWVEVKDATGRTMLSQTLAAGQKEALSGTPPFEVVVGNAPEVIVTYRGEPVDLAPHIVRGTVARLKLQ